MTDEIRVGVIGAGANTRLHHIPGLQAIRDVRVVAVCNRSVESGRRVAQQFGIERVEDDPEAFFTDPAIDAICIGTWPYRHREYTVRGLESGKHVLCEARMAMDAGEAHAMLEAARAHPDLVAQLVPAPFDLRSWRTVRRLVADGSLGAVREVHATMLTGAGLDPAAPLHWRERREYSGMNTMQLGIFAEVVQRWLGTTDSVIADAAIFVRDRRDPVSGAVAHPDIPDSVGVLARMTNGARATYRLSNVAPASREANGISVHGEAGTLHWSAADDSLTFARLGEDLRALPPDPGTEGAWQVEQDFIDSIREGQPVELTSFEDGLRYMQFTEAVWRSWNEGRSVEVASL